MSALLAPAADRTDAQPGVRDRSRLRAVPTPASRMARFPFLLVLFGVFGLGMAGLLMLNTSLQSQAFAARDLNRRATELTYTQADLENQLTVLAAPAELARRASAMGMRTNPYPALVELPSGTVLGKPTPVSGTEMPSQIVKTPAELAAEKAAAAAKKRAEAKAAAEAAAEAKAAAKRKAAQAEAAAKKPAAEAKKPSAEAKKPAAEAKKPAAEAKKPATTKKNSSGTADGGQG